MKKIMLGLVAAFALASFATPVLAEEAAAGDAPKAEKKAKKGKKAAKKDDAAAPADDAAKK